MCFVTLPLFDMRIGLYSMNLADEFLGDTYGRQTTPCQFWPPAGTSPDQSPTSQEYILMPGTRNTGNILSLKLDDIFGELCPVWKPALPGGPSFFIGGGQQ